MNVVGAFIRNAPFGTEIAFRKGLEAVGVSVNAVDTSYPDQRFDADADATLVFKWMEGSYWDDLRRCRGPKIVYQPDDLRFPHIQDMMRSMREYCDYALTFDASGAELARGYGYLKAERLLLTADPDLYRPLDVEKDIDVCFVGSLTYGSNHTSRRQMVELIARERRWKLFVASDLNDPHEVNRIYNRSRVVLNHATDVGQPFGHGYGYQCRHFEAGFARSCLLSNSVPDRDIRQFMQFNSPRLLIDTVEYLLENPSIAEVGAQALEAELHLFHRPEHRAVQLLDFIDNL